MSQHNKSRKHVAHRSSSLEQISRLLLLVGVGLVVIVIGLIIRSNRASSPNGVTAQAAGAASTARIAVFQDTFDYGDVKLGTTVETVFHVRNVGDQPLVILNNPRVQVAMGCCPPRAVLSSNVIQPGQEATITLNFMMHQGMGGKHRFNIDLQTNDPTEPTKQLVVLSNWI